MRADTPDGYGGTEMARLPGRSRAYFQGRSESGGRQAESRRIFERGMPRSLVQVCRVSGIPELPGDSGETETHSAGQARRGNRENRRGIQRDTSFAHFRRR